MAHKGCSFSIVRRYDSLERAVKEAPTGVTDTKVQKFINGIVMTEKIMLQVLVVLFFLRACTF
jgi:molecular chaperone GrpE (heat shock protein)